MRLIDLGFPGFVHCLAMQMIKQQLGKSHCNHFWRNGGCHVTKMAAVSMTKHRAAARDATSGLKSAITSAWQKVGVHMHLAFCHAEVTSVQPLYSINCR